MRIIFFLIGILLGVSLYAQWNNPHSGDAHQNTMYSPFTNPPKSLDPARAYNADELQLIAQIYEPPLQYHYLNRPYQLQPLTLSQMPTISYFDKNNRLLPKNAAPEKIAYTVYDLKIKPGIYFQSHPAFAKSTQNNFLYHHLTSLNASKIKTLHDFEKTATRELIADDYVYQIKRLASPTIHSPIFGVMDKYIVGFRDYAKTLQNALQQQILKGVKHPTLDLRDFVLSGVTVINRYEYQIKIHGVYPQFQYWLAMPFFAPIPWEADLFYQQPGLTENNITLNWYPVGTGPYLLHENNPNQRMVLLKNPHFHSENYPTSRETMDAARGYLNRANQPMPFVEKLVLTLDRESIPRWSKFLQGYYDRSGISADSFDQAIRLNKNGEPELTKAMLEKGIRLQTTISPSVFYIGFNMLDDVVGSKNEKNKKLRQAIAIAIDYEEYIQLFLNGRGIAAQSPIPPGIFGYEKNNFNKVVYFLDGKNIQRKPLNEAKKLLAEAGYPNGIDPKTGKALVLHYDVSSSGNPDDKSQLNWMRKQFAKLGIQLDIRHTEYNRFQDKVRTGQAQIFSWGWLADYPDPENFLFLLASTSGKVKFGGENASNYSSDTFDQLFHEMKNMPNSEQRLEKIRSLLDIIREDNPWIFGAHPVDFTLSHAWVEPAKPHSIANNTLKYQKINIALRANQREKWNAPILWPFWILLGFLILIFIPLVVTFWRRENKPATRNFR